MKDWAELIRAIASLLWPILGGAIVFTYRNELKALVPRILKGKVSGVEIELSAASELSARPLASTTVLQQFNELVASADFKAAVAVAAKDPNHNAAQPTVERIIDVIRDQATATIAAAFIKVDSRPLLGRFGEVWEESFEEGLKVSTFLDRVWAGMRAYVVPYTYRTGWVIRDRSTGKTLTEIGTRWAKEHGLADDDRLAIEVGIKPGALIEVVPGPNVDEALDVQRGIAR